MEHGTYIVLSALIVPGSDSYLRRAMRSIGMLCITLICLLSSLSEAAGETWQLTYSSFIPGNSNSLVYDVASDEHGNTILAGRTFGGLEVKNALKAARTGQTDGFVIKFNPAGQVVFATYFGGGGNDHIESVKTDANGNIYLAGYTNSQDFPSTHTISPGKLGDAFFAKLNSSGTRILYSVVFGGSKTDFATDLVVDPAGDVIVIGETSSKDFPRTPDAFQSEISGNLPSAYGGFLVRLRPGSRSLRYGTFIGEQTQPRGVAVDENGSIYVAGTTYSRDFPIHQAIRKTFLGRNEGFIMKFDPLNHLVFSTFLGGSRTEDVHGLSVSKQGIFVCGETSSYDFPVKNALFSSYQGGRTDGFLTRISLNGTTVFFSTFLGGRGTDSLYAVRVGGSVLTAGKTNSANFPPSVPEGRLDAFLVQVNIRGSSMLSSSRMGGFFDDSFIAHQETLI